MNFAMLIYMTELGFALKSHSEAQISNRNAEQDLVTNQMLGKEAGLGVRAMTLY